jgi:hypothetical protein
VVRQAWSLLATIRGFFVGQLVHGRLSDHGFEQG